MHLVFDFAPDAGHDFSVLVLQAQGELEAANLVGPHPATLAVIKPCGCGEHVQDDKRRVGRE